VLVRQTDAEHEMLGWLHAAADEGAAVVLNGGAWTHYSYGRPRRLRPAPRPARGGAHLNIHAGRSSGTTR